MRRRVLSALFAVLFVAACGTTEEPGTAGVVTDPNIGTQFPPGSEEQFVAEVGDRVLFGFDRFDLAPEARATLDRQSQWLTQYPSVRIVIEGHADERGTREYNLALGDRRANAVRNYLVASGIDPTRIDIISFGKERPAIAGSNESAWAQNRRGVTVITAGAVTS